MGNDELTPQPQSANLQDVAEKIFCLMKKHNFPLSAIKPGTTEPEDPLIFLHHPSEWAFLLCQNPETGDLCPLYYVMQAIENAANITGKGAYSKKLTEFQIFGIHGREIHESLFFEGQALLLIQRILAGEIKENKGFNLSTKDILIKTGRILTTFEKIKEVRERSEYSSTDVLTVSRHLGLTGFTEPITIIAA